MESGGIISGNNEELKIGWSEYQNTDQQKNFNSSYCEIKTDNLNEGIAIMIIINNSKDINLKKYKSFFI